MTRNESIGIAIREQRRSGGMSQRQLALKAGIHRRCIQMIEHGERGMRLDTLEAIAKALDCTDWSLLFSASMHLGAAESLAKVAPEAGVYVPEVASCAIG